MKQILSILAVLLCVSLPAQFYLKGLTFGIGGSGIVQQSSFNHIDFTGITDWKYKVRLQWSCDVRAKYYADNLWQFGLACGVREAGWNKVNDHPEMEPHWEKIKYSFLYSYLDVSAGRSLFKLLPQVNWNLGVIQNFNFKKSQKLKYVDGSCEEMDNDFSPTKLVTVAYLGMECRLLLLGPLVATVDYKFQVGLNKFREEIIKGTQIHHSVGLNLYLGVQ